MALVDTSASVVTGPGPVRPGPRARVRGEWANALAFLPFLVFVSVFLLWPAIAIFVKAMSGSHGFSFVAMRRAVEGQFGTAFVSSIRLSVVTSVLGGVIGTLLAAAIASIRRPRWVRTAMTAWSGVAANLGGIPLAFAFFAALGTQGIVTKLLSGVGVKLGYGLSDFWGLVTVYLYFQIPLMLLVVAPAVDGLRPAWREAAANLGARPWQYWRYVGIPILAPSVIGGMALLFANAFSAYATAYALSSGSSNIVPLQIRFVLQGNVITGEENLGYALAAWTILLMGTAILLNIALQRRSSKWLR